MPAYDAFSRPYSVSVDSAGDIFYHDHALSNRDKVRVVYAGGAAAELIKLEVGVSPLKVGYVYRIGGASTPSTGYAGDGGLSSSGAFDVARDLIVTAVKTSSYQIRATTSCAGSTELPEF